MAKQATEKIVDTKDVQIEYIPMVIDGVENYLYTKEFFEKGIDEGSYMAGYFTSLINSGIDYDDAIELLKRVIGNK